MQERSSKRRDLNESAFSVVAQATGEGPRNESLPEPEVPSAAAIRAVMAAMGRTGGLRGGKARAKKLSAVKRKALAKKAATAKVAQARAGLAGGRIGRDARLS